MPRTDSSSTPTIAIPLSNYATLQSPAFAILQCKMPDNWIQHVHPQGWLYFSCPSFKIVTAYDIRAPDIYEILMLNAAEYPLSELEDAMEVQLSGHRNPGSLQSPALNLVINHLHCVASYKLEEVRNDTVSLTDPYLLNRRRRLYWNFVCRYPSHIQCPDRAIPDASGALTWYYMDNLVRGSRSTVPFSKTECEELRGVLNEMMLPQNANNVAKTAFLAWFLREVCSFRDAEYYGLYTEGTANTILAERQGPNLSPALENPSPSPFVSLFMNVVFFGIPKTYVAYLKQTFKYKGRLNNMHQNWGDYVSKLVREYSTFLVISTVLLSATVSFLAVPGASPICQLATTASVFTSLGSIIVGVFSIWRHQENTRGTDAYAYMRNAQHNWFGIYGHAMLLSLPAVLIVWSILAFAVSIVVYALQGMSYYDGSSLRASAWIFLAIFVLIVTTVIGAIHTLSNVWTIHRRPFSFLDRVRSRCVSPSVESSAV
ncbi:hypothetical protein IW261DRAFT_1556423 [Armillaria novae-zelandiae]|uniref:Uncharacterized protein n=1 Tax=Armillaria novae-zelandiae TaxID=153914 RepID=A0AA39UIX8_9AGAR|nr:hypothetical protein IW261DRAFT_1556423 [Armillaria novae-zelandiae]